MKKLLSVLFVIIFCASGIAFAKSQGKGKHKEKERIEKSASETADKVKDEETREAIKEKAQEHRKKDREEMEERQGKNKEAMEEHQEKTKEDMHEKDEQIKKVGPITLRNEEKWEERVDFAITRAGKGQRVNFTLFKDNTDNPYLTLYLIIDVMERVK